jgi:hypothetical protein
MGGVSIQDANRSGQQTGDIADVGQDPSRHQPLGIGVPDGQLQRPSA